MKTAFDFGHHQKSRGKKFGIQKVEPAHKCKKVFFPSGKKIGMVPPKCILVPDATIVRLRRFLFFSEWARYNTLFPFFMSSFYPVDPKASFPKIEEKILAFWKEQNCFRESINRRADGEEFVFFDGPPFATGLPHYGHILAGTIKDVIPRFQTMKGKIVSRRFGWDCHGVPVEHEIEKRKNLKSREDIEKMGIKNFNEHCRSIVLECAGDWKKIVDRMGRWVDFQNDYKTMDPEYMESILWVFSELWKKERIYEGKKVVAYSPKLASTLSNFEANLNYKDIDDPTVTAKFLLESGEKLLAWTTTPWTLPTNLALCVHPKIEYARVEKGGEIFIVAKNLVPEILGKKTEILETFVGKDLIGKKYEPLFPFFKEHKNAFRVVGDDFVSDSDGTGIVHLAPTGEEDARILTANKIALLYPYTDECFFDDPAFVDDLNGLYFRRDETVPVSLQKNANTWVLAALRESGKMFSEKSIRHSYPHCWRTDCALMYRGVHTFFVDIQSQKEDLITNNANINWNPKNIGERRFGNLLKSAPDWAISRSRFWGAPIPVWKCEKCETVEIASSVAEIAKKAFVSSKVFVVRHGEADHNVKNIMSTKIDDGVSLTKKGRDEVRRSATRLQHEKIDLLFSSPLLRAQQTAEILRKELHISADIVTDMRLREIEAGEKDGCDFAEWSAQFLSPKTQFSENPHGGESAGMVQKRTDEFYAEIQKNYPGKNILVVGHGATLRRSERYFHNTLNEVLATRTFSNAEIAEYSFEARPQNDRGELDLHRPYIDHIFLKCPKCAGKMTRVSDVLDCWFESGSVPYASTGYGKARFSKKEPQFHSADFIAEGLDQTRGWFYTMHVLGNALFEKEVYKNVIVNGIVLAEDGQKMSKSKKNYPDPNIIFDTFGADAMRFYLMNSPVVAAADFRFVEKGVEEVLRKVFLPLWNVYSFFVTYANIDAFDRETATNISSDNFLDEWILAELSALIATTENAFSHYKIDEAAAAFAPFLDKLTNFYIRRSRRRFWKSEVDGDKNAAFATLYTVLKTVCRVLAPIAPFLVEELWQNLKNKSDALSVHFTDFPSATDFPDSPALRAEIDTAQTVISLGLFLRSQKKIRVRQPLADIKIALPASTLSARQISIILEELNIKRLEVVKNPKELAEKIAKPDARKLGPKFGREVQKILREAKSGNFTETETGILVAGKWELSFDEFSFGFLGKENLDVASEKGIVVALDCHLSEQLKKEGIAREIIRHLQELRKQAGYEISEKIVVSIIGADAVLAEFSEMIVAEVLARNILSSSISHFDATTEIEFDGQKVAMAVKRN